MDVPCAGVKLSHPKSGGCAAWLSQRRKGGGGLAHPFGFPHCGALPLSHHAGFWSGSLTPPCARWQGLTLPRHSPNQPPAFPPPSPMAPSP
eukprot:scaffold13272_cov61-Isochrysis_galbana.AAC.1